MTKIQGEAVVLVSKCTRFNPAKPDDTPAHEFALVAPDSLDEHGALNGCWAKDGYVHVGMARIEINLMPQQEMTQQAVAAMRKQKEMVLAAAQAEATQIEGRIQSLLAIANETGPTP